MSADVIASEEDGGLSDTRFLLPADARLTPLRDLSLRLQAKIGPAPPGHVVVSRPGFRVTTRLVSPELARLMDRFREPRSFVDAVLDFSRTEERDPFATLEDAFDALATLVDGRLLVPADSPESQAVAPSLATGQAFGRYEIVALVQALEDSEVYEATDPDEAPVALKIGRPGGTLSFAHESLVLARLVDGDTPALLEAGETGGRRYLAMAWRDGVQVTTAAQQARSTGDRSRLHGLVSSVLAAYGRLHARGVVHADIHPGNVLVAEDGAVTLLDFGRARLEAAGGIDLARAGIPQFYEPEMAAALSEGRLPPAATPRGEQAAVAALAYMLLTGLAPVDAGADHDELLARIATRPPLPFTARGVAPWPEAERVLARALAKDPGARFPDMADFAAAFAAATPSAERMRRPPEADAAIGAALDRVQRVWDDATADEAMRRAWIGLRAALAWGDPDLLAAADVWASRSGESWPAWAVRADVARARCDRAGEVQALAGFVQHAPQEEAPLLALARMLDGAAAREVDATGTTSWANACLQRLDAVGMALPACLALARAGVLPLPVGLGEALRALPARAGDASFWALACDAYAEPLFAERAGQAARRSGEVLDLLRLYQLTGEPVWLVSARRRACAAARRPLAESDGLSAALRLVELETPFRPVKPPFE